MIRVIQRPDRALHARALATMFEDRKYLFVDLLGWDVPVIDDRFEIDCFDNVHCVYLIAVDDAGDHMGSMRLLPTLRPHILDSLFADLCPSGVPTGPQTYEITRLCLPSRLGAAQRLEVRNALISAMVDHALDAGIARLTGVVDAAFRREVLSMGWLAEPLGPIVAMNCAKVGAFAVHIRADTPARLGWTGIYPVGNRAQVEGAVA
jgi:N-acyl-L-homoserine lactone synthetase